MEKVCIICKQEKELNKFDKRIKSKDGYRNQCRNCLYKKRKNNILSLTNEQMEEVRIRKNELNRKYHKNRTYESKLKEKNRRRKCHLKRLESDPLYKLRIAYSRRINKCIKRFNIKNIKFLENLGCSLDYFKSHIESKFEFWMNWNNYGKYNGELNYGWDIDHIIPISKANTLVEFNYLCNYKNLQPLCSKINRDIKKNIKPHNSGAFSGDDGVTLTVSSSVTNNYSFTSVLTFSKIKKYLLFRQTPKNKKTVSLFTW